MRDLLDENKPKTYLMSEDRLRVQAQHMAQQEAELERARLTHLAAKAALEAVRREIEGE